MNWTKLENKKPTPYKSGCWDGLKSDKVLVCTYGGKYHIAEMYEGVLNGNAFCDFFDENDFEIHNVVFWTEIDAPF